MNSLCTKCGVPLEAPWEFCPHCGAVRAHEHAEPAAPAEHESSPAPRAFEGLFLGLLAAPIMLIVGTMLLITGIGAVPGILLMAGGVLAPLIGPLLGFSALHGKCPWCGTEVKSVAMIDRFCCHSCKGKIKVRKRELVRAA